MDELVVIDPDQHHLGDLRVLRGLTQVQLAGQAGISTTYFSSLELGQAQLTASQAIAIARCLDLDHAVVEAAYERTRNRPPNIAP